MPVSLVAGIDVIVHSSALYSVHVQSICEEVCMHTAVDSCPIHKNPNL